MIHDLERICAPNAFEPTDPDENVAAAQRVVVDEKLAAARDRMTWPDVPTRVLVRSLIHTARAPWSDSEPEEIDPALPLARALLARNDQLLGTDAGIVDEIRGASDAELDAWVNENGPWFAGLPACSAIVDADEVLEVSTSEIRTESLSAIWPCIQPLNWPHCNDLFRSVTVVPGSFTATPAIADFAGIVPDVDLSTVDAIYGCCYVEDVDLPGLVANQPMWEVVPVETVLQCIEWQRRDASGDLREIGMAYRHSDDDSDNAIVAVDEGFAILRVTETPTAPATFEMTTLKRISFQDPTAIEMLNDDPSMCELFCLEWSFNFEVTADDCEHRAVVTAAQVKELSDHPRPTTPRSPAGPPVPDHWLAVWLGEASAYWQQAASVGFRELQRLEERRSRSDPTRSEDVFYDALEVWEANRRSLNDGVELTARFWSGVMGGLR